MTTQRIDEITSLASSVALGRIAEALETIAGCMTEDRDRQRASEREQHRLLVWRADRAAEAFGSFDAYMMRLGSAADADDDARHREAEAATVAAEDALAAYLAAHPWLRDAAAVPA